MYTILYYEYYDEDNGHEVYDHVATFKYKDDVAEYLILNDLDEDLYIKVDGEGIFSPEYFLKICFIDNDDILDLINLISADGGAEYLKALKLKVLL